jgi:hypothetical protein
MLLWALLQNTFSKTHIDSSGYKVAMPAAEITEVKAKKEY